MPKEIKVKLKVSNGRIQLVYTHQGRRNYLSLGLSDTAVNRRLAELKAAEIEQDVLFDRYKGIDFYRGIEAANTPVSKSNIPDYKALWNDWIQYKYTNINQTTQADYQYISTIIERCPNALDDAVAVKNWLLSNHSYEVSRRFIEKLNAFFQWAINQNQIDFNPYKQHKLINKSAKHRKEINPFTAEERDKIIDYCLTSEWYAYYLSLIEFIFFTGCRPSEAIALRWSDFNKELTQLTFSQAANKNEHPQIRIKSGLKTQKSRRLNLNDRVGEIINRASDQRLKSDTLVFPSKGGGVINWQNFRKRCWRDLLLGCEISYRNPYQMRHTFITLALRAGMPVTDVAALVGNSPAIIYRHYAGVSRDLILPDI